MQDPGNIMKTIRIEKGLSQEKPENNPRIPAFEQIEQLSKFSGKPIEYFRGEVHLEPEDFEIIPDGNTRKNRRAALNSMTLSL